MRASGAASTARRHDRVAGKMQLDAALLRERQNLTRRIEIVVAQRAADRDARRREQRVSHSSPDAKCVDELDQVLQ